MMSLSIKCLILLAVFSGVHTSAQELLPPISLGTIETFEGGKIVDALQLDNNNIVIVEIHKEFKSAGFRIIKRELLETNTYGYVKIKDHQVTPKRATHTLNNNSVFLVKTQSGFAVIANYYGRVVNGRHHVSQLKFDYFDENGILLNSFDLDYGSFGESRGIARVESDGAGGIIVYGSTKNLDNTSLLESTSLLAYRFDQQGNQMWKKNYYYRSDLCPDGASSRKRRFSASDCQATKHGFLFNGSIRHIDKSTSKIRFYPFLLKLDLSGNLVKYDEYEHENGSLYTIHQLKNDQYVFGNFGHSSQSKKATHYAFNLSFKDGLGTRLNSEYFNASDVYQIYDSQISLIQKGEYGSPHVAILNADNSVSWSGFSAKNIRKGNEGTFLLVRYNKLTILEVDYLTSTIQKVKNELSSWEIKGKYEKQFEYDKRVNSETRKSRIDSLTSIHLSSALSERFQALMNDKFEIVSYDAESEIFKMKHPYFGMLYFAIPIKEAENFENQIKAGNIQYADIKACYYNDRPSILSMIIGYVINEEITTYEYSIKNPVVFNGTDETPSKEIQTIGEVFSNMTNN